MHGCVVLWGCTGILGKAISLPASILVCWRTWIVTGAVLLLPRARRGLVALPGRLWLAYAAIGVVLALHWITFYASIKLANASVGASCMGLAPIFLSLLAPVLSPLRFDVRELAAAIFAVPGVALVVGGVPDRMQLGLGLGVASAALLALVGIFNKRYVEHADALVVTGIEMAAGALAVTLHLAFSVTHVSDVLPGPRDAALLLMLALGCTLLPYALSLVALRRLSAFSAQLIVNIEPVYTIVLAIVLFGEQRQLDHRFYLGVALILIAIFVHPFLQRGRGLRRR
jgi:drug/metabolite transporter (DMT)-like permease